MPPHVQTALVFIGVIALIIWILVRLNKSDGKKDASL